jgi:hypothetical protein
MLVDQIQGSIGFRVPVFCCFIVTRQETMTAISLLREIDSELT